MNHGLIVAGDDPAAIRALSHEIVAKIDAAMAASAELPAAAATDWEAGADQIAAATLQDALGAGAVAVAVEGVAASFPATEAGRRFLVEAADPRPDRVRGIVPRGPRVGRRRGRQGGGLPRRARRLAIVAVAPGLASFAVGESGKQAATALGVYVDALTVGEAGEFALGRVRAMDQRERRFIETWRRRPTASRSRRPAEGLLARDSMPHARHRTFR